MRNTEARATDLAKMMARRAIVLPQLDRLSLRPLTASVALILSTTAPATIAAGSHLVTTCNDPLTVTCAPGGDDGTLRHAYFCATGGDTIDLTQLQCSKITLHGPLTGAFGNVTLNG